MIAVIVDAGSQTGLITAAGLSGVLVALGAFLKTNTPLPNNYIPLALLVCGLAGYLAMSWPPSVESIITGIGASLAAVGAYQGTRNTKDALKGN